MQSFEISEELDQLDSGAFKFNHKLLGHPALSLENIAKVLPELASERVEYSKGLLGFHDNFETKFQERPANVSLEETIENIRVSDSYIMVNGPETHPSFAPVFRQLVEDVEILMHRAGAGNKAIDPRLFLFIASPNSVTPFHIDRYSNFLMQFRGSKHVSVFPQWDERIVSAVNRENYMSYSNTKLPWTKEIDALGTTFDFKPGEAIHIPFAAGHHVRNGSEDVSISMGIFFNTEQNKAWRKALRFNGTARRVLNKVGLKPAAVGKHAWRDKAKAWSWDAYTKVRELQTKSHNMFTLGLSMVAGI